MCRDQQRNENCFSKREKKTIRLKITFNNNNKALCFFFHCEIRKKSEKVDGNYDVMLYGVHEYYVQFIMWAHIGKLYGKIFCYFAGFTCDRRGAHSFDLWNYHFWSNTTTRNSNCIYFHTHILYTNICHK